MTQDDLNRVLTIQANVNEADAAAIQALIDAATEPAPPVVLAPPVKLDPPGLYAVIDPTNFKVVEYVRGDSPADIIDKNRQYATYLFHWIEA